MGRLIHPNRGERVVRKFKLRNKAGLVFGSSCLLLLGAFLVLLAAFCFVPFIVILLSPSGWATVHDKSTLNSGDWFKGLSLLCVGLLLLAVGSLFLAMGMLDLFAAIGLFDLYPAILTIKATTGGAIRILRLKDKLEFRAADIIWVRKSKKSNGENVIEIAYRPQGKINVPQFARAEQLISLLREWNPNILIEDRW